MKKKTTLLIAGSLMAVASVATAANKAETFYLSPLVGGYTFEGKQHLKTSPVYGIRLGYNFTKRLGLEGGLDYSLTESTRIDKNVALFKYGADLIYNILPDSKLVPFLALGYGGYNFDGPSNLVEDKVRPAFDYGAGLKYFLNDSFAIRGDVRHIIASVDSEWHERNIHHLEYTLGAYIPFGAAAPAAKPVAPPPAPVAAPAPPPPAPKPVVAPPAPAPAPKPVPPPPAPPADRDRDGVPDDRDRCPNTPQGVTVDTSGCPVDSDKDGVSDYLDKCPASAAGEKVAADGCAEPVASAQKASSAEKYCNKPAVVEVHFATGKAEIKKEYVDDLKALADFLKEFPTAKGEISGHTDNVGAKAMNQKLSQQRAESVKKYMVNTYGIDASRITAKGYGFDKPIASNKTKEGKAKNRRIEANFSCE